MKKTVNANIAGTVFHIEEDAYEQLQRYLSGIRAKFNGSPGAEEIMADIEARIAELFNERMQGRNVVNIADVQHVEGVMGRPEDFAGDEVGAGSASDPGAGTGAGLPRRHKRLFRDMEDNWIGGVIAGFANYVGTDPLWVRIAFLILFFLTSFFPLLVVYILMWVLVPAAATAAEKLEMRGEPVTVDNLKRVFEEGGERMKAGGQRVASEARNVGRNWQPRARSAAGTVGTVIIKLIGATLVIGALCLLISLVMGLIGGTFSIWHSGITDDEVGLLDIGGLLFSSSTHALWFGIGVIVLLTVPIIALFLAGFRLLLETRTPKWLGWSLVVLWFGALFPTLIMGLDLGFEFHHGNRVQTEETITQPTGGTIYLDATTVADSAGGWQLYLDDDHPGFDMDGFHISPTEVTGGWATCDVERSADSLFHLIVQRESRGRTTKAAHTKAERIRYHFVQEGDVLRLSPMVRFDPADKLRAQQVHFRLLVPEGRSVFFRPGSRDIIYDIDNTTNTWDDDMIGRSWTMTPNGLEDEKAREAREQKEKEKAAADSTRTGPVAAVVWPGPRKAKAFIRRAPAERKAVTSPEGASVQLPNVFRLFSSIVTLR